MIRVAHPAARRATAQRLCMHRTSTLLTPRTALNSAGRMRRLSAWILLFSLLSLFSQLCVKYVLLDQIANREVEQSSLYIRVFPALPIVFAFMYAVATQGSVFFTRLPADWARLARMSIFVMLVGTVIALIAGNSFRYIASDVFRCGVAWTTLFVVMAAAVNLIDAGRQNFVLSVVDAMVIMALIDALMTIIIYTRYPWFRVSTELYLLAIPWALFQTRWPRWMALIALSLGVLALFLSGKRGALVAVAAFSPVILWHQFDNMKLFIGNVMFALLVCLAGGMAFQSKASSLDISEQLWQRAEGVVQSVYDIFVNDEEDQSMEGRMAELRNVVGYFQKAPYMLPLGGGFGAETEMREHTGVYSSNGGMHQVHVGWGAYLLRNGFLGVLWLFVFCYLAMHPLLHSTSGRFGSMVLVCSCFVGIMIVLSLKSQLMLETLHLPMMVGISVALVRANRLDRALRRRKQIERRLEHSASPPGEAVPRADQRRPAMKSSQT